MLKSFRLRIAMFPADLYATELDNIYRLSTFLRYFRRRAHILFPLRYIDRRYPTSISPTHFTAVIDVGCIDFATAAR